MTPYRTSPADIQGMPPGIPHIIGNEAAERFSFYGMKAVLAVFMANYLHLMNPQAGGPMSAAEATEKVHLFNAAVYLTPFFGALLSDVLLGKYRTIILLSIVYCLGHGALAFMGVTGDASWWLFAGLGMIALGSGGIKPCVSAHVGDQFGGSNAHLLPRIFNWFYFSINFGAAVSMLLTPWLLEWYGPHWAFGVPGVLMAIATFLFWQGRHRFIHVPPAGKKFFTELFKGGGVITLLKLAPVYLFVAIFWALFDQTGSTWIFQAQDMDRQFLGRHWLPSQIQSINSIFILTFIPLFSYFLYPAVSRVWKLTPLRKIGAGLFIMAASFSVVAMVQEWIDAGGRPNIGWQVLAFALLTAAEIMVSIVALEFAYTQAPKTMKSLVMCFYLGAVSVGNFLVAGINHYIQVPSAAAEQLAFQIESMPPDWQSEPRSVVLTGISLEDPSDDILAHLAVGALDRLEIPGAAAFEAALARINTLEADRPALPEPDDGNALIAAAGAPPSDLWGNPILYERLNSTTARLRSAGPDRSLNTQWDLGLVIEIPLPSEELPQARGGGGLTPEKTWLERRKEQLGVATTAVTAAEAFEVKITPFVGGQTRLQGAAYFHFFTRLMLFAAIAFVPFAMLYRPKTYLQD